MKDKAALIAGLQQAPGLLEAFVASIPADKLHRRRGTGFWMEKLWLTKDAYLTELR